MEDVSPEEKQILEAGGTDRRGNRMKINPKKNSEGACLRGSMESAAAPTTPLGNSLAATMSKKDKKPLGFKYMKWPDGSTTRGKFPK